jgi:hypothetical protein
MPRFMVHHTFLEKPNQVIDWWNQASPTFGEANKSGQFPAKCLYTWIPGDPARHEEAWCLWEAESADLVRSTLRNTGILEHMGADVVEIGETNWMA